MEIKQQEQLKKIADKGSMLETAGVLGTAKAFVDLEDKVDSVKDSISELADGLKKKLESELVLEIDREELKGDKGEDGIQGEKGEKGAKGDKGDKGDTTIAEKIIERTEVIKEQPIVTEITNNVENPVTGEDIVSRVNDLPTDDEELKIDAKHIKNLPKVVESSIGAISKSLYQLADVSINQNTLANGDVPVYNSVTKLWENGAGGGSGSPAAPDKSVQFNDNGAFGGETEFRYNKNSNQLAIGEVGEFEDDPTVPLAVTGNDNTYFAAQVQNLSTGDGASSDIFVAADNDSPTQTGHFGDFGIFGSGFTPSNDGVIETVAVSSAGSFDGGLGYTVGDILTIETGNNDAEVEVLTVNGSGKVLTVQITSNGTGYSVGINNATSGGTGSGCYIDIISNFDFSGFEANDVYAYASGGNMILGTDSGVAGKNLKVFLGGFSPGNKVIEVSQSQGTSGVIPQLDVDPGDPFEQSAWVLKSGGDVIPDGTPIGLLLGLTYTDVTPVNTYQLSYYTKEGTIIRTALT